MNNAELIKALKDAEGYMIYVAPNCYASCEAIKAIRAAADALEAAEQRIDGLLKLVDINTDRCEALRKQLRESHESYEQRIAELEAQLPKEGEWIRIDEYIYDEPWECSNCETTNSCRSRYCPNCGAKMDGETEHGNTYSLGKIEMPKGAIEQIIEDGERKDGERRTE